MLDVLIQLGDAVRKRQTSETAQKKTFTIFTAARSSRNEPPHYEEYTEEMLKRMEEAEEVPEDL